MAAVTWDPSDKDANITLSNGDLTATNAASATNAVRATLYRNVGKFYYEVTVDVIDGGASNMSLGFGKSTMPLANNIGYANYSVGYLPRLNRVYREGAVENVTMSFSALIAGDVLGCGIDLSTGATRWYKNGVESSTNVANVATGSYAPAISESIIADSITANFGASSFVALPSGYLPWDFDPRVAKPSVSRVASQRPVHFIRL